MPEEPISEHSDAHPHKPTIPDFLHNLEKAFDFKQKIPVSHLVSFLNQPDLASLLCQNRALSLVNDNMAFKPDDPLQVGQYQSLQRSVYPHHPEYEANFTKVETEAEMERVIALAVGLNPDQPLYAQIVQSTEPIILFLNRPDQISLGLQARLRLLISDFSLAKRDLFKAIALLPQQTPRGMQGSPLYNIFYFLGQKKASGLLDIDRARIVTDEFSRAASDLSKDRPFAEITLPSQSGKTFVAHELAQALPGDLLYLTSESFTYPERDRQGVDMQKLKHQLDSVATLSHVLIIDEAQQLTPEQKASLASDYGKIIYLNTIIPAT